MNIAKIAGKYIDQPLVLAKCSKAMPIALVTGAGAFAYKDIKNTPKEQRKSKAIKNLCVLTGTVASALIATKGFKPLQKIFKNFDGLSPKYNPKEIIQTNTNAINEFLQKNNVSDDIKQTLEKAKDKVLNTKEIKKIYKELPTYKKGKELLETLIPEPKAVTAKEIKDEIGRLSIMGAVPIVGGIAGGIVGDKLTEKNWKEKVPNKIKEGFYQYFANIFLCNVGAGIALGIMEKMNIKSKSARALGMVGGILTFGVIGGSAIANVISKKIIDPILGIKHGKNEKLYNERKPEALDIGLHVDDVATISVLSGLKWIEPALPILYSISGYRAGIGYRNGGQGCKNPHHRHHTHGKHAHHYYNGSMQAEKMKLGRQFSEKTFNAFS